MVGRILELDSGKFAPNSDGDSVRIELAAPDAPVLLEVVTDRPQYRVHVATGEWEGEWFVKRRKVTRMDAMLNVECAPSIVSSKVEIRAERQGGTRAIGEEPCD